MFMNTIYAKAGGLFEINSRPNHLLYSDSTEIFFET